MNNMFLRPAFMKYEGEVLEACAEKPGYEMVTVNSAPPQTSAGGPCPPLQNHGGCPAKREGRNHPGGRRAGCPHPAAPCGGARPCGAVKTVPCERGGGQRPTGKEKKRRTANPCRGRFHIGPQTVEKADCFPAAERLPCLAGRGLDPAAPLGFQIMTVGTCFLNLRRCGGRNRPPYRATGNGSRRGNGWFPDTLRRPCNKLPQMPPASARV